VSHEDVKYCALFLQTFLPNLTVVEGDENTTCLFLAYKD